MKFQIDYLIFMIFEREGDFKLFVKLFVLGSGGRPPKGLFLNAYFE